MTDPTQPSPAHPSPDELADLRAGLLPDARERDVSAHVTICAQCTDELAAMDDVEILLAEAGREPVPMPDDVARNLGAALARVSRERAAGVASLDEKRASKTTSGRLVALLPRLGVAAAVVIIAGVAIDVGINNGDDRSADSADSGGSQTLQEGNAQEDSPGDLSNGGEAGGDSAQRMAPQRVTRDNLQEYARELSQVPVATAGRLFDDAQTLDTAKMCPPSRVTANMRRVPVRFDGTSAYVVVKSDAREVSVYACDSTRQELYSTSY